MIETRGRGRPPQSAVREEIKQLFTKNNTLCLTAYDIHKRLFPDTVLRHQNLGKSVKTDVHKRRNVYYQVHKLHKEGFFKQIIEEESVRFNKFRVYKKYMVAK